MKQRGWFHKQQQKELGMKAALHEKTKASGQEEKTGQEAGQEISLMSRDGVQLIDYMIGVQEALSFISCII